VTDTNVFQLCQPGAFADSLTEVLRNRASAAGAGRRGRPAIYVPGRSVRIGR
jgi:hypothetical protein